MSPLCRCRQFWSDQQFFLKIYLNFIRVFKMWQCYWNGSEYISKKIICHFNAVNVTWFSESSGANFCLITFPHQTFWILRYLMSFLSHLVFCQKKSSEVHSHFGYWLNVNILKKEDYSSTAQIAIIHTFTWFVNFESQWLLSSCGLWSNLLSTIYYF